MWVKGQSGAFREQTGAAPRTGADALAPGGTAAPAPKKPARGAPPSFVHLRRMTDDTGLIEHAVGRIPRRREGYTTDDNARALWTATEWLSLPDGAIADDDIRKMKDLCGIYMAFMLWNQNNDGWWHNNIAYDRSPEPEQVSHDCQGRAVWACADAWVRLEGPLRETARIMVERSLPTLVRIDSLRGRAFAMAACAHLLEAGRNGVIELPGQWKPYLKAQMNRLQELMNEAFRHFSDDSWRWFEPAMTYSNGVLAWALLRTYRESRKPETLKNGLDSLSYLVETMTAEEGWLRPIGNDGWCTSETISRWDQQPLEMFKLALALEEAALAVESIESEGDAQAVIDTASIGHTMLQPRSATIDDPKYLRAQRDLCLDWFYGRNDLQVPMADPSDGSCCDGLSEHGPNLNCGAESTIAYLMTEAICRRQPNKA